MKMHKRKQVLLLFTLGALVLLTICPGSCLDDAGPKTRLLKLPDFKLESRVRVITPSMTQFDEELEVTEYYSNVQRRARLDIHTIHKSSGSTNVNLRGIIYFYRSGSSREYLRMDAIPMVYSRQCKLVEPSVFTSDLFEATSNWDGKSIHEHWLEDRPDVPDYVIGLARLLLIVESNKEKLELTLRPEVSIRNQKAREYTLKDKILAKNSDELVKLTVYYADTEELHSDTNFPLRIWLITPDFTEIIVDYTFGGAIWPGPSDPINEINNFFSFPAGFGCSADLQKAISPSSSKVRDVFSFKFERENLGDDTSITRYFVAHDGYSRAVRLDKLDQVDIDEAMDYSITIGDFQRRRYFNIRQPVSGRVGEQPEIDSSSINSHCAASLLVPDESEGISHEYTLPFDQMVEMGTSIVRGIKARTFEHVTNQLPGLFFPKLWYRNPRTMKYEYIDDTQSSGSPWVVVYFFSAKTTGLSFKHQGFGQLLRVDVIKLRMVAFRIEVHDFMWSLQMAPNGDGQDELFALRDRCSQVATTKGLAQDRYANLEMELEYNVKEIGHMIPTREAQSFIKWPSSRRQELTRALVMADSLGATNLYDLESKMKPFGLDKLLVKMEAKVMDSKQQPLFEAIFMGPGTIIQSQTVTMAANVDECFWDAVHQMQQSSGEVLFSFCFQACVIDPNPELRINPDTSDLEYVASSVFKISAEQPEKFHVPCDIMRVEQLKPSDNVDKDGKEDKRPIWRSIFSKLNKEQLFLPLADPDVNPDTVLPLRVKRIELSNSRWSEDTGRQGEDAKPDWHDEETLRGLGLSLGSWSERVMPPPTKFPTSLKELEDLEDADAVPMSFDLCQDNCMTDMKCRSFSICAPQSSSELVCLKSELEFRQPELLNRIAALADPLKKANKQGSIHVNMEPSADLWGLQSSKDTSLAKDVELVVDKRCRLYNKSALQMFKFTRTSESLKVKESSLMSVDSEEQCAERCTRINLNFFKRSSKIKVKSLLNKDSKQQNELLKQMLADQENNLATWCKGFDYINLATASISDELKSSLGSSKTSRNGLCRVRRGSLVGKLNDQSQSTQVEQQVAKKLQIKSNKYELIYSNLYEKRPGFRLRNKWPSDLDDEHDDIAIDKLVEKMLDHNRQTVIKKSSVNECARACFLQTSGMKPPCKSFGLYREPTTTGRKLTPNDRRSAYCILNSMTLDEALKSENSKELVIELDEVPEHVMMHYDPKSAYNMDNLVMAELLIREKSTIVNRIKYFQFSLIGLFILIVASLATGLWLGLTQGQRYLDKTAGRRESVSSPSRSFLASLVGSNEVTHQRFETEIDLPNINDI